MKSLISTCVFAFALLLANSSSAQTEVLTSIKTAFKKSDATTVSSYFGDVVEVNVGEDRQRFGKEQAIKWMTSFLKKYPVKDFQVIHQGSSDKGVYYAIGEYTYEGGKFRTYLLLKQNENSYLIDMLDFGSTD